MEQEVIIAVHPFFPWTRPTQRKGLDLPPNYEVGLQRLLEEYSGAILVLEEEDGILEAQKRMPENPQGPRELIATRNYNPFPKIMGSIGLDKYLREKGIKEIQLIGGYFIEQEPRAGCVGAMVDWLEECKFKVQLQRELLYSVRPLIRT